MAGKEALVVSCRTGGVEDPEVSEPLEDGGLSWLDWPPSGFVARSGLELLLKGKLGLVLGCPPIILWASLYFR